MTGPEMQALELLVDSVGEVARQQAWLAEAVKQYGNNVIDPAPGVVGVRHQLDVTKARARGRAEVLALFLSRSADDVVASAAKEFYERGGSP